MCSKGLPWVLIPCLIGPAQQAIDTLLTQDLGNYKKVQEAILQTLNLSPKGYRQCLREIEFGPDYLARLSSAPNWPTYTERMLEVAQPERAT